MNDEQFLQLLDVLPDAVVVIRESGEIACVNRQAEILLGYAADELIGQPLDLIVPARFWDQYIERSSARIAEPLSRRMTADSSSHVLCKNGDEVPVDISLRSLETIDSLLVIVSLRNTSAQRRVESDLRNALADLRQALADVRRLRDQLAAENLDHREAAERADGHEEMVGESPALRDVLNQIDQVAETDANVLILGETGTGKELVARAIHAHSRRKDRPLIKLNCAALPNSLIESELFGHEAGAFTGAISQKIGRFELADGGTIFLDEIGELPVKLQSKLLRVIQEGVFWRLGSVSTTQVNVRVIAATNRDLRKAMQQDKFRSDLYFRLAVFPIEIPPLRERSEDIPQLVWYFISQKQAQLGKQIEQISPATMDRLIAYPWPGNIRELENVLERAMILSPGSKLLVEPLLDAVEPLIRTPKITPKGINQVMRDHILRVLQDCHWRIKGTDAAADRLKMNPSTLRYRMKTLGIQRPN